MASMFHALLYMSVCVDVGESTVVSILLSVVVDVCTIQTKHARQRGILGFSKASTVAL